VSKAKVNPVECNDAKIAALLLALAVIDEHTTEMWQEFARGVGRKLSKKESVSTFVSAEAILSVLDALFANAKIVSAADDQPKKKAKKGVKKNERR
jgi:hypothetical protein